MSSISQNQSSLDVTPPLRGIASTLVPIDVLQKAEKYVLIQDSLSEFSCRRRHYVAGRWFYGMHAQGRVHVHFSSAMGRLQGIRRLATTDPVAAGELATSFVAFMASFPNDRIVREDWDIATELAEALCIPEVRDMYFGTRSGYDPRAWIDVQAAIVARVRGLVLVTSSVERFMDINEHLKLPGLYDALTGIRHI